MKLIIPILLLGTTACRSTDSSHTSAMATQSRRVTSVVVGQRIKAVVSASDRAAADRQLDAGRQPGKMLAFFGIKQKARVAELGAGSGYTAELLARAVGPSGKVYGENSRFILDRFAEKPWSARLKKSVMANAVRLDRPFDDPFPKEVGELDAVLIVLFYHDTYWQGIDRAKMNRAVFRALKSKGIYGIVDHSAKPGAGSSQVKTLHRIEENLVRQEIEAAGFRLVASADFLRNASDQRDWNAAPRASGGRRGTSDRFVLKFIKP